MYTKNSINLEARESLFRLPQLIIIILRQALHMFRTIFKGTKKKRIWVITPDVTRSIRRPRLNSLKLSVFVENFSLIILIIIFFKINSVFVKIKAKYEKCTFLRKKKEICVFIGRAVKVPLFSLGFQN